MSITYLNLSAIWICGQEDRRGSEGSRQVGKGSILSIRQEGTGKEELVGLRECADQRDRRHTGDHKGRRGHGDIESSGTEEDCRKASRSRVRHSEGHADAGILRDAQPHSGGILEAVRREAWHILHLFVQDHRARIRSGKNEESPGRGPQDHERFRKPGKREYSPRTARAIPAP